MEMRMRIEMRMGIGVLISSFSLRGFVLPGAICVGFFFLHFTFAVLWIYWGNQRFLIVLVG